MFSTTLALALLTTFTLAAPVVQYVNTTQPCATLQVIVARGTCENQITQRGEGIFYKVANMITAQVPGSNSTGLVYPATGAFTCLMPNYVTSVRTGNSQLVSTIQSYSARCPNTKFALIGYSQGGQVVGDVVCGMSEKGYGAFIPPLSGPYLDKVVAAITFGDPGFVANEAYDRGTATSNGVAPRTSTAPCPGFAGKLQAYCNVNDMFCATGNSTFVHGQYVVNNGLQGANFVVERYNNATSPPSSGVHL